MKKHFLYYWSTFMLLALGFSVFYPFYNKVKALIASEYITIIEDATVFDIKNNLTFALSWASIPLIIIAIKRIVKLSTIQEVFSIIITTLVALLAVYLLIHIYSSGSLFTASDTKPIQMALNYLEFNSCIFAGILLGSSLCILVFGITNHFIRKHKNHTLVV